MSSTWARLAAIFLFAGAMALSSSADLLVSESFDYPTLSDGDIIDGASGGTGWSGSWGNIGVDYYRNSGLTFPGDNIDVAGGHLETRSFSAVNFRSLDSAYGTDGSTLWLRFLIERDDTDAEGNSGWTGLSLFQDGSENLFIGKRFDNGFWGIERPGGAAANTTVSINNAGPAMMLVRIAFQSGAEAVDLWALNSAAPENEIDLGAASATISATDFTFDRMRIGSGSNVYNYDEIFMGETYSDILPAVVPEPSSLALLLVAGALLKRWRRGSVTQR